MLIGVHTPPLYEQPLPDALEYLNRIGVDAIEPGVGGHPGHTHLPPADYLDNTENQSDLHSLLDDHEMTLSALAVHNNPLHPDEDRAAVADEELRRAIRLAAQLDVNTITCFSGLPAGAPSDTTPNWITAPWPPEHREALDYQWTVAREYWEKLAGFAADYTVDIAIEMHPNMLVHEPTGLVNLRDLTNKRVGANFDPSHLYWQGIDIPEAIRYLGSRNAIHHVHAKDTAIYESNTHTQGVLDPRPYTDEVDRSWLFRTVGYGHSERHWKEVISTLRLVGYDGAVSVEHEDSLTSAREGLEKAISFLQRVVFTTQPEEAFWTE